MVAVPHVARAPVTVALRAAGRIEVEVARWTELSGAIVSLVSAEDGRVLALPTPGLEGRLGADGVAVGHWTAVVHEGPACGDGWTYAAVRLEVRAGETMSVRALPGRSPADRAGAGARDAGRARVVGCPRRDACVREPGSDGPSSRRAARSLLPRRPARRFRRGVASGRDLGRYGRASRLAGRRRRLGPPGRPLPRRARTVRCRRERGRSREWSPHRRRPRYVGLSDACRHRTDADARPRRRVPGPISVSRARGDRVPRGRGGGLRAVRRSAARRDGSAPRARGAPRALGGPACPTHRGREAVDRPLLDRADPLARGRRGGCPRPPALESRERLHRAGPGNVEHARRDDRGLRARSTSHRRCSCGASSRSRRPSRASRSSIALTQSAASAERLRMPANAPTKTALHGAECAAAERRGRFPIPNQRPDREVGDARADPRALNSSMSAKRSRRRGQPPIDRRRAHGAHCFAGAAGRVPGCLKARRWRSSDPTVVPVDSTPDGRERLASPAGAKRPPLHRASDCAALGD